jgi:hypothetical protein
MHIILISYDEQLMYHLHPDDFGDVQQMSQNGSFYFDITFPRGGIYAMAVSFVFSSDGTMMNAKDGDSFCVMQLTLWNRLGRVISPHQWSTRHELEFYHMELQKCRNLSSILDRSQ